MTQKTDLYPHDCPDCGEPAYLGLGVPAKCSNPDCSFFDLESLEDQDLIEGWEEEKTDPQWTIPLHPPKTVPPRGLAAWLPTDPNRKPFNVNRGIPVHTPTPKPGNPFKGLTEKELEEILSDYIKLGAYANVSKVLDEKMRRDTQRKIKLLHGAV